uniref:BD-FAE-like domain-containing protein n=1 Tax=Aureoumbra lagunensis TaxID=44058 RepID=A0A7S3NQN7_9STRA
MKRSTKVVVTSFIVLATALRPTIPILKGRSLLNEVAGATVMSVLIGTLVAFQLTLPQGTDVEGRVANVIPAELSAVVRESKLAWQFYTTFEIGIGFVGLAIESARRNKLNFITSLRELASTYKSGVRYQLTPTCAVEVHDGQGGTLVFAPGGAWSHGDDARIWNILAQRITHRLGYRVIIIEYSAYPSNTGSGMISDVLTALRFASSHYMNDQVECKEPLVFCGHSAGVHLIATALLNTTELLADGVLLLSGPYDLVDHLEHERKRGVAHVSVLETAFRPNERSGSASPTVLARHKNVSSILPRIVLLAHGDADPIVPITSFYRFAEALNNSFSDDTKLDLRVLQNVSHLDYLLEAFLPPNEQRQEEEIFFRLLRDTFYHLLDEKRDIAISSPSDSMINKLAAASSSRASSEAVSSQHF